MAPPVPSSIPSLHAFDPQSTSWKSYRDRIKFYFEANRIVEVKEKKALFLWSIGDATYQLLDNLISPRSLTNEDVQFEDLLQILNTHYDDTKNIMTPTYDFYSCLQKEGQPFSEWKAELCEKLRHCGFTTLNLKDKPQDRALRDMYVIGVRNPKIRQALLKEQDPDLEKTERIIQLAERLQEDVRHFGSSLSHAYGTVNKIHRHQPQRHSRQQTRSPINSDYKPCETCGSSEHLRSKCKYREYTCNFCNRLGHLERVCRQKKETNSTTHIATIYKLNVTNQKEESPMCSTTVPLRLNNHDVTFELDTGTFNTIISMEDWYKLGSPTIRPSTLKLKCYSVGSLKVKGECNVKVQYKNQIFNLSMIIVYGPSPPLLGLQWIRILKFDLNRLVHRQNDVPHPVHKIYSHSKSQTTLQKYKHVLNKELGHGTKVQAHIQCKPDTTSKSSKSRQETQYKIGQLVWSLNPQLNKRSQWQSAIVVNHFGSMVYEVQISDGQRVKRHQNQIRLRHASNDQSSDIDSSPNDLLNKKSQSIMTQSSPISSPRYPRRHCKPPDRYSP